MRLPKKQPVQKSIHAKIPLARRSFSHYIIGLLLAAQVSWAQTPPTKEAFEAFTLGDYRAALKLYAGAFNQI